MQECSPSGQQPRSRVDWLIGVQLVLQQPWCALPFNPESGLASCDCKCVRCLFLRPSRVDQRFQALAGPRVLPGSHWPMLGLGRGPARPICRHGPMAGPDYPPGWIMSARSALTRLGPPARCSLADVMAVLFLASPRPPSFTADRLWIHKWPHTVRSNVD